MTYDSTEGNFPFLGSGPKEDEVLVNTGGLSLVIRWVLIISTVYIKRHFLTEVVVNVRRH